MQNNRDKLKKKATALAVAYSKVFESEDGKLVLHNLMDVTNFNRSPFSKDPYETAFEAGRQSIIHEIVRAMNIDLEKYLEIVLDHNNQQQGDLDD